MTSTTAFPIDPLLAPRVASRPSRASDRAGAAPTSARTPAVDRRVGVSERTFRRRRRVVGAFVVFAVATVVFATNAFATDPSSDVPPAPRTIVAQPGDTLWGIARKIAPTGDITELVHALVLTNGSRIEAGQIVRIP